MLAPFGGGLCETLRPYNPTTLQPYNPLPPRPLCSKVPLSTLTLFGVSFAFYKVLRFCVVEAACVPLVDHRPPPRPVQGGALKWQTKVVLDPTSQFAAFILYAPSINFYQTSDPHSPTGFVPSGTVFTGSAGPSNNVPLDALGTGGVVHGFRADTGAPVMNVFYTGSYCSDIVGLAIQGLIRVWGFYGW